MDATEEGDVALQRASSDLLLELRESISKFVYKQRAVDSKTSIPRHAVRNSATARLIKLVLCGSYSPMLFILTNLFHS